NHPEKRLQNISFRVRALRVSHYRNAWFRAAVCAVKLKVHSADNGDHGNNRDERTHPPEFLTTGVDVVGNLAGDYIPGDIAGGDIIDNIAGAGTISNTGCYRSVRTASRDGRAKIPIATSASSDQDHSRPKFSFSRTRCPPARRDRTAGA